MKSILVATLFALSSSFAWATVNLNTASKDDLVALPGIGPVKAQAILDYRAAHGPFKSIEQLKDVKGIGAKRFEKLKPELSVATGPAKAPAANSTSAKAEAGTRNAKGEIAPTGAARAKP